MRRSVVVTTAAVIACLALGTPADAKVPVEVSFSSGGRTMIVRDPALTELFVRHLCSGEPVADAPPGTSIAVTARWTSSLVWTGRLFPSTTGGPAVVDIPEWRMSSSDSASVARCGLRAVPEQLDETLVGLGLTGSFFEAPSVTTIVAPKAVPTEERSSSWSLGLAGAGALFGALGAVALAFIVLVRLPPLRTRWYQERQLLRAARAHERSRAVH